MGGDQHHPGVGTPEAAPKSRDYKDLAIKVFAVVGFLTVLGAGTFMAVSAVKYTGPVASRLLAAAVSVTSVFVPREEQALTLNVSSTNISSGENVILTWTPTIENGNYLVTYPCVDGFRFETDRPETGAETLFCNTEYQVASGDTSVVLRAISEKNRYVDMPITLAFTETGETAPSQSDSRTITVANANLSNSNGYVTETQENSSGSTNSGASGTNTPSTPSTPSTGAGTTPTAGTPSSQVYTYPIGGAASENPNGKADLKVTVLEIGVVDKISGSFAKTNTLKRSDRIGVRFSVENVGDKSSGEWRFNAILPTFPPHTFNSDAQTTLRPGDHIDFTIGFDQAMNGTHEVKFVIDPQQKVTESNEDNNTTTVSIVVE